MSISTVASYNAIPYYTSLTCDPSSIGFIAITPNYDLTISCTATPCYVSGIGAANYGSSQLLCGNSTGDFSKLFPASDTVVTINIYGATDETSNIDHSLRTGCLLFQRGGSELEREVQLSNGKYYYGIFLDAKCSQVDTTATIETGLLGAFPAATCGLVSDGTYYTTSGGPGGAGSVGVTLTTTATAGDACAATTVTTTKSGGASHVFASGFANAFAVAVLAF
ncbi:hypothetical protein HK100_009784 [Physocladia obscura]|uniref:Uncharacterized protein n=1 Tax=Physocladia obscura TaxID=109957 RepID=A0AAD5T5P0_9FUNG|nr:hypothetical protein HK100_009784 [Physocladia obscura]